ncbi:MAG: hypothetical protein DKM50_01750 [Candidatus Margulisiibacteriota bacterium]|nr:MAG: hypothetical protein A2X43_13395 [Candidatus Margulisbacteria bacterium GWD2_39_127]OGI04748.1 MAG: hypothetical protein A2X42_10600 [Candidatus Margulisbacteria bacterium GWF2_38_17]OGI05693.1 MAG: hypothetical protein A2X41_03185 [Candidatus Margulisbacteria bacterium GWE2_39_32]PZM83627.1 MAG: hypothetical protein DKM50_01750 [Candidatus Margulisiibacteriota bacterium]HAR62045.1 hypothetical protein [Candidatus Margulisiibacteriota bacterium]
MNLIYKKKMSIIIFFIFLAAVFLLGGCKQVTTDTNGAIYGSVLLKDQVDHSGVVVTARSGNAIKQGLTETSGMYVISGLTVGTYEVSVSKNAWYIAENDQATKSVVITEGESVMNVTFNLESDLVPPAIP